MTVTSNGNGNRSLKEKGKWVVQTVSAVLLLPVILAFVWLIGVGNTQDFQAKEIDTLQKSGAQQEQTVDKIREDVAVVSTKVKAMQETLKQMATKDDIKGLKEFMLFLDKKRSE